MSWQRNCHKDWRPKNLRVLVDLDCVLADFESHFLRRFKEKFPDEPFIPLAERKGFYLTTQYEKIGVSNDKIYSIINEQGYFRSLPAIPGGAAAVSEMSRSGVDVFLCTSPVLKYQYCVGEKYDWVNEHLGTEWTERLILTRDKSIIHADILIDDRPRVRGCQAEPLWKQILFTGCHNRTYKLRTEIGRLDNWEPENWKPLIEQAMQCKTTL